VGTDAEASETEESHAEEHSRKGCAMSVTIGGVDLYMGPTSVGGPDDLDQAIRDFIDDAKHSLAIAVQEIDSRPIAKAILAAKLRGVRVRVILEGDYLTEEKALVDPWTSEGAHEENRIIQGALLKAKVDVIADLNPKIFHQKFIVRDSGKPGAAVLTGSTNFTLTDTGTNATTGIGSGQNLNHVVVLHGQRAATEYLREFERMRSGTFGALHERVEPKPKEFGLPEVRVKPLFAPRHGPEMEIMKQMLKAKDSIDFAMFTFAQSSGIDDTMIRLRPLVQRIRGVLDRDQGAAKWAATTDLGNGNVELFANRRNTGVRKLHHKLMVIDERLLIVGSFNYTAPANTLNDENIIVIGDLEEPAGSPADVAQRELAAYALTEIDRIIADLSSPVPA
jgi:phosphatidylserine/phosphatidylglycerophosphate/cardiolipin synthase-like enzyme